MRRPARLLANAFGVTCSNAWLGDRWLKLNFAQIKEQRQPERDAHK